MNVYDEAHNLARAIKESTEFQQFDNLRREIEKDETTAQMLKDLQAKQMEIQAAQMTGQEPNAETITQMQSLATMIATKPLAAQYMQAEAAFSVMVNDVFGILGEAMGMK